MYIIQFKRSVFDDKISTCSKYRLEKTFNITIRWCSDLNLGMVCDTAHQLWTQVESNLLKHKHRETGQNIC